MKELNTEAEQARQFSCGHYSFPIGARTYLVGILNVTPDSFSDGGCFLDPSSALYQAEKLLKAGADILDVGGESTRPGAAPIDGETEKKRIIPVIQQLVRSFDCAISVDTSKPSIAAEALDAGAVIVNDVMGLQQSGQMAAIASAYQAGVVIMHNARLYRQNMEALQGGIIHQMKSYFNKSIAKAEAAGLKHDQILLDPGIGFGVSTVESIEMIRCLNELSSLGYPLFVGPSRKRFIRDSLPDSPDDRLMGTAAAVAVSIMNGADFVRVHDVAGLADFVRMIDVLCRQNGEKGNG